ncbi:hypothetical protein P4562_22730 [Lysinibacillus xylanilyticus]|uniref:hypothetical protein n=1 Tax=Lysinibacillus xylanilyticus TaxID=582475 RepID=UPI002E1B5179|nr:hypothetical protein [Lysinibacillus xylanilyticus]
MSRPIAVVVSNYKNLDGQFNRSSGNFSTKWFGNSSAMDVEVTVDGEINKDITFGMAIDISNGEDDFKYSEVRNGSRLQYYGSNTFYICNIHNNLKAKNFMVRLFPVV